MELSKTDYHRPRAGLGLLESDEFPGTDLDYRFEPGSVSAVDRKRYLVYGVGRSHKAKPRNRAVHQRDGAARRMGQCAIVIAYCEYGHLHVLRKLLGVEPTERDECVEQQLLKCLAF